MFQIIEVLDQDSIFKQVGVINKIKSDSKTVDKRIKITTLLHFDNVITLNEWNVLFNDTLNTIYSRLYGVTHMVKDHSDSEKGNQLPPHGLLHVLTVYVAVLKLLFVLLLLLYGSYYSKFK